MNFILNFLKGFLIGIGSIMPGVSGGSLAVIFGLYDKITNLISHAYKEIRYNFKKNFIFFLPIGLGGVIGVLLFSGIMEYLFTNYNVQIKYLFIGLIVGTFPLVFKDANKHGYRKIYIVPFIISLALTIIVTIIDNNAVNAVSSFEPNIWQLIMYGAILGFGTIIPGISASFILMYLGSYDLVLAAISEINIPVLIPLGIGFVLSIVLFAKIINILFEKFYGYTYYTVLGFVIGSIIPIFPGFEFSIKYMFCILILTAGFLSSYYLSKIKKNNKGDDEENQENYVELNIK